MSDTYANLVYANDGVGRVVHIDNVISGLACGCTCPECGEPLIARKGDVRAWHFAHVSGTECVTAPETALHRLAKQWICGRKCIDLPQVSGMYCGKTAVLEKARTAEIISAEPERSFGDVVPDIYAVLDGNMDLFVEIYVTHAVDADKISKLSKIGIATLELDLSKVERDIGPVDFDFAMKEALRAAAWAYHPAVAKWIEGLAERDRQKAAERSERAKKAAADRRARRAAINAALEKRYEDDERRKAEEQEAARKRAALDAVYARLEAERKEREAAERQARLDKAARDREEYAKLDELGKLFHRNWCPACGGELRRANMRPDPVDDTWRCDLCGRMWDVDTARMEFRLSAHDRVCPDCGRPMKLRDGRYGKFYGCTGYPECRCTVRV